MALKIDKCSSITFHKNLWSLCSETTPLMTSSLSEPLKFRTWVRSSSRHWTGTVRCKHQSTTCTRALLTLGLVHRLGVLLLIFGHWDFTILRIFETTLRVLQWLVVSSTDLFQTWTGESPVLVSPPGRGTSGASDNVLFLWMRLLPYFRCWNRYLLHNDEIVKSCFPELHPHHDRRSYP